MFADWAVGRAGTNQLVASSDVGLKARLRTEILEAFQRVSGRVPGFRAWSKRNIESVLQDLMVALKSERPVLTYLQIVGQEAPGRRNLRLHSYVNCIDEGFDEDEYEPDPEGRSVYWSSVKAGQGLIFSTKEFRRKLFFPRSQSRSSACICLPVILPLGDRFELGLLSVEFASDLFSGDLARKIDEQPREFIEFNQIVGLIFATTVRLARCASDSSVKPQMAASLEAAWSYPTLSSSNQSFSMFAEKLREFLINGSRFSSMYVKFFDESRSVRVLSIAQSSVDSANDSQLTEVDEVSKNGVAIDTIVWNVPDDEPSVDESQLESLKAMRIRLDLGKGAAYVPLFVGSGEAGGILLGGHSYPGELGKFVSDLWTTSNQVLSEWYRWSQQWFSFCHSWVPEEGGWCMLSVQLSKAPRGAWVAVQCGLIREGIKEGLRNA